MCIPVLHCRIIGDPWLFSLSYVLLSIFLVPRMSCCWWVRFWTASTHEFWLVTLHFSILYGVFLFPLFFFFFCITLRLTMVVRIDGYHQRIQTYSLFSVYRLVSLMSLLKPSSTKFFSALPSLQRKPTPRLSLCLLLETSSTILFSLSPLYHLLLSMRLVSVFYLRTSIFSLCLSPSRRLFAEMFLHSWRFSTDYPRLLQPCHLYCEGDCDRSLHRRYPLWSSEARYWIESKRWMFGHIYTHVFINSSACGNVYVCNKLCLKYSPPLTSKSIPPPHFFPRAFFWTDWRYHGTSCQSPHRAAQVCPELLNVKPINEFEDTCQRQMSRWIEREKRKG